MTSLLEQIEQVVDVMLKTYSNVHRGSGHHSLITTQLYEQARTIVLSYLGLNEKSHMVIFASSRRAARLKARLAPGNHRCIGSQDIGIPLGIRALAIERKALPKDLKFEAGGGTARLVAPNWVIWANAPHRFEAGTPAITNVIAFACALKLIQQHGEDSIQTITSSPLRLDDKLEYQVLEEYTGRELLEKLRRMQLGKADLVPTLSGEKAFINLDNGASTPTFQPIWDAVRWAWRAPKQSHLAIIQQARSIVADTLGAPLLAHEIIFTSNTTEANNLVAENLAKEVNPGSETVVLNTFLEHNSNELPWRMTPGLNLVRLSVDPEGFINLAELESVLADYNQKKLYGTKRIKLVAISGASNVLCTYNPIAEICRIVHRYGARLFVDAAQWVAHRKVEIAVCEIDYFAFSGHKVYAPFGSGVLIARRGLLKFNHEEMNQIHTSGEENVGGIFGLAQGLRLLSRIGFDLIESEEQALTKQALSGLAHHPWIKVYGVQDTNSLRFKQKGGVIVFDVKGWMPHQVARALAEQGGMGVRAGCFCAHLLIKRILNVPAWAEQIQRLLLTLWPKMSLPGLIRISFGIQNTQEDIEHFLEVITHFRKYRRRKALTRQMGRFIQTRVQQIFPESNASR